MDNNALYLYISMLIGTCKSVCDVNDLHYNLVWNIVLESLDSDSSLSTRILGLNQLFHERT
jgi:hypothetical protein